uniref:AAA_12 domain-containing protein n=1 Tax=Macrostomum lignano TaxID=282301 RepID=A0A1I8F0Z5_9PLAT
EEMQRYSSLQHQQRTSSTIFIFQHPSRAADDAALHLNRSIRKSAIIKAAAASSSIIIIHSFSATGYPYDESMTDYVGARQLQQQSMPDEFFLPFNYERAGTASTSGPPAESSPTASSAPADDGRSAAYIGNLRSNYRKQFSRCRCWTFTGNSSSSRRIRPDEYPYSKKSVAHEFDDYPQQQQQQQLSGGVDD